MGGQSDFHTSAYTTYHGPNGVMRESSDGTVSAERTVLCATYGVLRNFKVTVPAALGAGNSYTWTYMYEAAAKSLAVTISGASQTTGVDCDPTHAITVAPGKRLTIRKTYTGAPPLTATASWCTEFESLYARESPIMGCTYGGSTIPNNSYSYNIFGISSNHTGTYAGASMISANGTIKDLYFTVTTAPGAGNSITVTLTKNDATTTLTTTISDTNLSNSDTSDRISVVPGDRLGWLFTTTGTSVAVNPRMGVTFLADNDGESNIMSFPVGSNLNTVSAANNFITETFINAWDTGNEVNYQMPLLLNAIPKMTLSNLYAYCQTPPGASGSYSFHLRKNQAETNPAMVATCSGAGVAGQKGNDTTDAVEFRDGDTVAMQCVPAGSPETSTGSWGIRMYINPANSNLYPKLGLGGYHRAGGRIENVGNRKMSWASARKRIG